MNRVLVAIGGAAVVLAAVLAFMTIRASGTNCGTAFGNNGSSDFASVLQTNSFRGVNACQDARQGRQTLVWSIGTVGLVLLASGATLAGRDAAMSREPESVRSV
jgi:heme A synthase